jgi:hypothetical protein
LYQGKASSLKNNPQFVVTITQVDIATRRAGSTSAGARRLRTMTSSAIRWGALGDLNGDGVPDLAVGAPDDKTDATYHGAVYVLFMNGNGTVKNSQKIASGTGGGL